MRHLSALAVDGREYLLRPLPPLGRAPALLCEAPLDAPLPRYGLRRHLRARIEAAHRDRIVVFTDAARSAEIWSRTVGGAGAPSRTRERLRRAGEAGGTGAPWAAELVAPAATPRLALPIGPRHPAVLIPLALLRLANRRLPLLLRRGGVVWRLLRDDPGRYRVSDLEAVAPAGGPARPAAGLDLRQLVVDAIEHPAGPSPLGALWSALLALRVLDAECGSGDWLLDAAAVLEPLHLAALEQMRVWLTEESLERRPRRSALLREFECTLAAAGCVRGMEPALAFAREAIVLCTLHGADDDPALLAPCRRRLAARLRPRDEPIGRLPAAALRLRTGAPGAGIATRSELAHALAGSADAAERLRSLGEEAEALGRAERLLRRARLRDGMGPESLRRGLQLLEPRKRALSRELDAVAGADGSLHLFAEWNDVARGGGFHVVRGGGA